MFPSPSPSPSPLPSSPPSPPSPAVRAGAAPAAILLASSVAFVLVQLDVSIVNVALPQMGRQLGAGLAALQWVVDAYTLGFAALLLSGGALGERLGARAVFLAGLLLFALASLGCALAPGVAALNLARLAQGAGAALLLPNSLAILHAAYADDRAGLAWAVGCWTAAGGVSIAAGPLLGGLLLALAGWRAVFWINLPLCLAGFWLAWRVVPATPPRAPGRGFDLAGQLLAIVALGALVGAVIEAPQLGWNAPAVLAALAAAVLAGAAFVRVERRAAAPMLPLALFARRGFSGPVLFGALVNLSYYGVVFVLSLYLQGVRGMTPWQAGLTFLPLTATFIVANLASGALAARTGPRAPMLLGALVGGAGYALLALLGVSAGAGFLDMLPGLLLIPAGMGLAVPAMTGAILAGVGPGRAGVASAVLNTARQVGGAVGVALLGALAAGATPAAAMDGMRAALYCAGALLLAGAALAWWSVPAGAARQAPLAR
jgi:DHA2 family methylenomycin A resistance protein-like MFS transporter